MSHSVVSEAAKSTEMLRIAAAPLNDAAIPFRATLFDKSPTFNWLVAWHQDTALPLKAKLDTNGWGPWSSKDGVIYRRRCIDETPGRTCAFEFSILNTRRVWSWRQGWNSQALDRKLAGQTCAVERKPIEWAEDGYRNPLRLEKLLRQSLHLFVCHRFDRREDFVQR